MGGPKIFDARMSQVHQFTIVCAKRPGNPLLVPPPKKNGSFPSGLELVTLRDVIFVHWWGLLTLCHGLCVPSKGAKLLLCRTSIPGSRSTFWFFIFPGSGVYQGGSTEWQGGPQRGGWYHNLAFPQRFHGRLQGVSFLQEDLLAWCIFSLLLLPLMHKILHQVIRCLSHKWFAGLDSHQLDMSDYLSIDFD